MRVLASYIISISISVSIPARGDLEAFSDQTRVYTPDNSEVFPSILLIHCSYITAEDFSSSFRPSEKLD